MDGIILTELLNYDLEERKYSVLFSVPMNNLFI